MAAPDNSALEDAKKRARRRLVGAVVLALAAAVVLPMFLESDPKPLGPDVQIQIPAIDDAKFQNRLTPPGAAKSPAPDTAARPAPSEPASTSREAVDAGTAAAPAAAKTESAGIKTESPASAKASAASAAPGEVKTPAPPASAPVATPARKPATPANPPAANSPVATSPAPVSAPGMSAPPIPAPAQVASLPAFSLTATVPAPGATPALDSQPAVPGAAPPVMQGEFVVQLGAFVDVAVARDLAAKAGEQGYSAFLEPVTTKSGQVQRVRVGPFASRGEANAAAVKLKGAGFTAVVRPR